MFDLLPESGNFIGGRANIEFQEDSKGNIIIKRLSKHKVTNEEDALIYYLKENQIGQYLNIN